MTDTTLLPALRITDAEFQGPSTKAITIDLHGKSCTAILGTLEAGGHVPGVEQVFYAEDGIANVVYRDHALGIEQHEGFTRLEFWRTCTHDDPDDRLDGTDEATELSLDDILAVATAAKAIMRELH